MLLLVSGEGGADEDGTHVQHRLQGQTHAGSEGGCWLLRGGAVHHRATGCGETSCGGDGGRQRPDRWRPHPETSAGGGESACAIHLL